MQVARGIARAPPFWGNDFDQIADSGCINRAKKGELIFCHHDKSSFCASLTAPSNCLDA